MTTRHEELSNEELADRIEHVYVEGDIREAARRLRAMSWQPIESAPRDGAAILCLHAGHIFIAAWRDGGWWVPRENYYWKATHWMPLPPPPAGQGGG